MTAEIYEIDNGVLLTINVQPGPSASDPLAQRGLSFSLGHTYYESLELAAAAIPDVLAVQQARKALGA